MTAAPMNFSVWQWRAIVVLDVVIKAGLIYLSAAFVTLGLIVKSGLEPVIPFILMAASVSSLNFLCLFFGNRFVAWLERNQFQPPGAIRFSLVLIFANALFVVVFTALMSVVSGKIYNHGILSMFVAATNLMSILLVAAVSRISSLVGRSR